MTSKAGKLAAAVLLAVVAAMAQPAAVCEFGAGVPVVVQEATCQITIRASGEPQTGTYRWEVTREAAAMIGVVQVAEDGAFASEAFRAAARDIPHEVALGVVESLEEVMELLWAMQGDRFEGPPEGVANRGIDKALATLPGTKVLVVGNHEFPVGGAGVKDYGFEAVHPTLVCETDPPLLLTHEPLDEVPAGMVNVHGHLHGREACAIARCSRYHLNVNVELTSFRPVRLSELATAARALRDGDVKPQPTTAGTIARALELRARQ